MSVAFVTKNKRIEKGGFKLATISLLTLVVVIALGVWRNKNIGIISLAAALLLALFGGLTTSDIIAGFPTSLFLNLFGMFFFFSIAQANGSLDLLSKKVFQKLAGVKTIYPLMVFVIAGLITIIDPGGITSYVVLPIITMSIGHQMGYNPVLIGALTIYGSNATLMTPVGVFGTIARDLVAQNGYPEFTAQIMLNGLVMFSIGAMLTYIAYRGWKTTTNLNGTVSVESSGAVNLENLPNFNTKQKITLINLALMIAMVIGLGTHAGLTALIFSVVLLVLDCADEKEAFAGVPWGTIFIVIGIGNLLSVIELLGGLELLAELLGSLASRWTVAPILGITSSVMSLFSLAMAGPVPALIPTIDSLNASIGNPFHPVELISTIINGGFTAAVSPLSMGGAMVMAAYGTLFKPDPAETNKVFRQLFTIAIVVSIIQGLIANTGIYSLFI